MVKLFQYQPQTRVNPGPAGTVNMAPVEAQAIAGFGQAGQQAAKIWEHEQFKADDLASTEVANKVETYTSQLLSEYQTKVGKNALHPAEGSDVTPDQDIYQKIAAYKDTIGAPLNEGSRFLLDTKAGAMLERTKRAVDNHKAKALVQYEDSQLTDQRALIHNDLFAFRGDAKVWDERKLALEENLHKAARSLADTELIKADVSKAAFGVVAAMVKNKEKVGGTDGAYAHLYASMNAPDRAAALAMSKPSDDYARALEATSGINKNTTSVELRAIAGVVARKPDGSVDAELHKAIIAQGDDVIQAFTKDGHKADMDFHGNVETRYAAGGSSQALIADTTAAFKAGRISEAREGATITWIKTADKARKAEGADKEALRINALTAMYDDPQFAYYTPKQLISRAKEFGPHLATVLAANAQANADGGAHNLPPAAQPAILQAIFKETKFAKLNDKQQQAYQDALEVVRAEHIEKFGSAGKGRYADAPWDTNTWIRKVKTLLQPQTVYGTVWNSKKPLLRATNEDIAGMVKEIPADEYELASAQIRHSNIVTQSGGGGTPVPETPRNIMLQVNLDRSLRDSGAEADRIAYTERYNRVVRTIKGKPNPYFKGSSTVVPTGGTTAPATQGGGGAGTSTPATAPPAAPVSTVDKDMQTRLLAAQLAVTLSGELPRQSRFKGMTVDQIKQVVYGELKSGTSAASIEGTK